jgi:hypothetical protein
MSVVYDDEYLEAEQRHHDECQAAVIAKYGSLDAYERHCAASVQRLNRERPRAVRQWRLDGLRAQRITAAGATRHPRPRGAGRPRAAATRSSAASGDSGDDAGDDSAPPEPWRWADPGSWRSFVASIQSRDFEREIARERWSR